MNTIIKDGADTQSKKLLRFRLYGSFAHFNQPISNRFRNTYSVIPKPQLLGLIGSIVGLEGYKNKDTIPVFYQKLSNLKVYIKPNTNQDRKFAVTYNSMNSFCLLYTSDAADEEDSVDLGGRRIIKKKK